MSGFEIVGVVLGGIPLVISALEHYREGVTIIHKWRRYQRERQILVSTLRTEKVKLENTCEALLHGLVPRSQIRAMIEDPFRAGHWKDAQVRRKLKARLDTAFESFEEIVNQMHCGMKEMMQRLDIHPDTVVSGRQVDAQHTGQADKCRLTNPPKLPPSESRSTALGLP